MGKYVVGVLLAGLVVGPAGVVRAAGEDGTVVVREEVSGAGAGTFEYRSDLVAGGAFQLSAGESGSAEASFVRAAGVYRVREVVPAGWELVGMGCGITRAGGGFSHSGVAVDYGAAEVGVTLGAGDLVTCTFTNAATGGAGTVTSSGSG